MKRQNFTFQSATGVCTIAASCYSPDRTAGGGCADISGAVGSNANPVVTNSAGGDPAGSNAIDTDPAVIDPAETVLVINHGMAEHQERYLGFITFLTDHGITVYMHDMANHGMSNENLRDGGWFGERDGYRGLVDDLRIMVLRARAEHPGARLIVMGHSMGSFLCRLYTSWYPDNPFDGAIYMGTGGPNPAAGTGLAAASVIAKLKGKKHKSKTMDKLAFGSYGKRFEHRTAFDWLTRDQEIVDRYVSDPYCGFLFTVQGMHDLVQCNKESNEPKWFKDVPKDLSILLVSGAEDPVGDYGKGIDDVAAKLRAAGHTNVTEKLYAGDRHEILNELNKEEVMNDILQWIEQVKPGR